MFQITSNGRTIGFADVQKEGCIYKIFCSCDMQLNACSRIYLSDGAKIMDLGICVPCGDRFVLTKRVSAKSIVKEKLQFSVKSNNTLAIPVENSKEFLRLDKLAFAKFQMQNNKAQILIDLNTDQQGNDLTQECLSRSEHL